MYKNIIFDVYGTLVDIHTNEYELSSWSKLAQTLAFYGVNYTPEELSTAYFSSCELQIKAGKADFKYPEVDVVEVFMHIFANKGKKATKTLATHLAQEFRAFTTDHLRLYPNVKETLNRLRKAGKKLYVLSNAQACFTKHELDKLGLTRYFEGIVYSSEYKCAKPDKALFDAFFAKYPMTKKDTIYVGNDAVCDIQGARNARIDCLWIRSNLTDSDATPSYPPKFIINNGDFKEVFSLLVKPAKNVAK